MMTCGTRTKKENCKNDYNKNKEGFKWVFHIVLVLNCGTNIRQISCSAKLVFNQLGSYPFFQTANPIFAPR
jgi:hypothetical protein